MAGPAAVVYLRGVVHDVPTPREVAAVPARDAEYDSQGNFLRSGREARPGYSVHDLLVLTDGGGFASLVLRDEAVADASGRGFVMPKQGDTIDLPVYPFDRRNQGRGGKAFYDRAYSFAGSVYKGEAVGRRVSSVAAAS